MKICIKCNTELNSNNHDAYAKKNYVNKCHDCLKKEKCEYARKLDSTIKLSRSNKCRKKLKEQNPKLYTARQMYSSARKRAVKLCLDFNLDTKYVAELCVDRCKILGTDIKYGGGKVNDNSASIDRIVPHAGYIKGNIQIISNKANMMKSNANNKELIRFAKYVMDNIK